MHTSSPRYPLDVASASAVSSSPTAAAAVSGNATSSATFLTSSMRHNPSCEWREWEETLDNFGTVTSLVDVDTDMDVVDLGGLDQFLLATADDFLEPFVGPNAMPDSPIFAADQEALYEKEQDMIVLLAAGIEEHCDGNEEVESLVECKLEPQSLLHQPATMPPMTRGQAVNRHRKRKTAELEALQDEVDGPVRHTCRLKKMKGPEQRTPMETISKKSKIEANEQMENIYRRRYNILHGILEAWNTGGIEDLEEIADNVYDNDVTLISPDYSESLHGVEAVMSHWSLLLDAFPDGIMEEYIIQREEGSTEKMKATWIFSGTQIFPIFGVQPRHKKVCISGKSYFTFKGDRIQQVVLSWNYREALLKLTGVQPEKANSVASASASTCHSGRNQ